MFIGNDAPTPYEGLNTVLGELVGSAQGILGENFVGAYLQGSFAVGDFDECSDADFIVAVKTGPTDVQVGGLQKLHARIPDLDDHWARHLEGSYFPLDMLRSCTRRKEPLWYADRGSRTLVLGRHDNTAVVRQALRQHGIRLAGPEPASLVEPVPVELLRGEIISVMCGWGQEILERPEVWANRFYQGFIVLNYCRKWCDLSTGTVGSKRRGTEWAKARLDASWTDLIDRAWSTRPDPARSSREPADPHEYKRTLELLALIMEASKADYGSLLTRWR